MAATLDPFYVSLAASSILSNNSNSSSSNSHNGASGVSGVGGSGGVVGALSSASSSNLAKARALSKAADRLHSASSLPRLPSGRSSNAPHSRTPESSISPSPSSLSSPSVSGSNGRRSAKAQQQRVGRTHGVIPPDSAPSVFSSGPAQFMHLGQPTPMYQMPLPNQQQPGLMAPQGFAGPVVNPQEVLNQAVASASTGGPSGMDFQQMIAAAKAAAVVAENMQEMVRWQMTQMQQQQQQPQMIHDPFGRQSTRQPLPSPSISLSNRSPGLSPRQGDTEDRSPAGMNNYFANGLVRNGSFPNGIMNSNFSVTMTSPYADSPDTYNSSPLDPETALDAFLHNFSQDDQMSLLSGDVMDGSVFNIGMTGDSSSATEEQFYTGTFAGSSNRSSSPSTDSTLSVTKDTIFDQMGDATMMESMNAEMLGIEGSGLSKLPAVGLIRDSSDSIAAPQNAVTSTTTPDSGIVLKRKRGRPAGKRDPTKDKKPAPAVAAATNAAALRKSGKAGMGTPSSAGGAPFLSNVAPLQAAPAPINAPVPALPPQAETKVAISRMPITPEQHSSNTQKRKEPSEKPTPAVKQQRKVAHNAIERRYRNNINERITELRLVVPALNSAKLRALAADNKRGKGNRSVAADDEPEDDDQDDVIDGIPAATKLNKATILRKATEYIIYLKAQVTKAQDEASELRRLLEGLPGGHDALRAWALVKSSMAAAASVEATTGTEAGASPPPSSPDSVRKSSESSEPDAKRRATSSGFIGTNYDGDDDDDEDFDDDEGDYETVMESGPVSGAGGGSVKMMAVMLFSASALYAPSPFDSPTHTEATHEHTPGKILGQAVAGVVGWNASATSSDSSPLPSAAAGYVDVIAVLGAGASALWVVAKIVIVVVGLLTLLFSLRSGSASSRIRLSGKQKRPAPQPAKRTSAIVKAALGVARESFNFIIAHIMGARFFAEIFFGLLPGGEEWLEEKRAAHVANVKAGLKRLNVEMTRSEKPSRIFLLELALHVAAHADLAVGYIGPELSCRAHLSSAIALRYVASKLEEVSLRYLQGAFMSVANYIWNEGIMAAKSVQNTRSPTAKWISSMADNHESLARLSERFQLGIWITRFEAATKDLPDVDETGKSSPNIVQIFKASLASDSLVGVVVASISSVLAQPTELADQTSQVPPVQEDEYAAFVRDFKATADPTMAWASASLWLMSDLAQQKRTHNESSLLAAEATWIDLTESIPSLSWLITYDSLPNLDGYVIEAEHVATLALYSAVMMYRSASHSSLNPTARLQSLRVAVRSLKKLYALVRMRKTAPSPPRVGLSLQVDQRVLDCVEFGALSWALKAVLMACVQAADLGVEQHKADAVSASLVVTVEQLRLLTMPARRGMQRVVARMRRLLPSVLFVGQDQGVPAQVLCVREWMDLLTS